MSNPDPRYDPENVRTEDDSHAPLDTRYKKKSIAKKMVVSKPALLKEHKHLLKVLKTGRGVKQEFNKQKKELKEYK